LIGVTWIGHATAVLDFGGVRLITDPLLRPHAGALRRVGPAPDPRAWAGADAVLVSHLHLDHADLGSLRLLPGVPALAGGANAAWLDRKRLLARPVGDEWVAVDTPASSGPVEVRVVRADHHSRPLPNRPNDAHGFLVRSDEGVAWFAGDTSLYTEMAGLADLAGARIDLALVPIHGWGPRLSEGHMDPAAAAQATALVRPRAVLPIHYGTFHPVGFNLAGLGWMHRPRDEFAAALARWSPDTQLLPLERGQHAEAG
jgi:L-ascorbate metabolism protein UlaG (beta-lactamase superfamily)